MKIMLVLSFLTWWYGRGWRETATSLAPRLRSMADAFSVTQLFRTWFAPWKRIVSPPGASLEDRARAVLDNLVSRFIGFTVRSFVLFAACTSMGAIALLTILEIIAWPLLPVAAPVCLVLGVFA